MNRNTITYRTAGSAALKPEYSRVPEEPTPIIDFETLVGSNQRQRVYRAPRPQTFSERLRAQVKSDPLFGSMDKAFSHQQTSSRANKALYAKYVLAVSLVTLCLILIAA